MPTTFTRLLRAFTRRPVLWLTAPIWLGLQACANSAAPAVRTRTAPLWGTQWQLQALGAQPVMASSKASLQFPEVGRVAGHGSCNRFSGSVSVTGDQLTVWQHGEHQDGLHGRRHGAGTRLPRGPAKSAAL